MMGMIPAFDDYGNLPQGIHRATFDDVCNRFGKSSPEREVETKELSRFLDWARQMGVKRVILNGSFITEKVAPNDVDLGVLPDARSHGDLLAMLRDEDRIWPFLHVFVAADDEDVVVWIASEFGTDRNRRVKGVVEVKL